MTNHGEPTLRELLDDPMVRAVMTSDGVARKDVRRLIENLPRRARARAASGCRPLPSLRITRETARSPGPADRTEDAPARAAPETRTP